MPLETGEAFALGLDAADPLRHLRGSFLIPKRNGRPTAYFAGHSLGLQPRAVKRNLRRELDDWAELGVEGHFRARSPWFPYHEALIEPMARVVGAKPVEVTVMNSLTVNLHLMLVSFYRPTGERRKILTEAGAFSSDRYAVASQIRFHGGDPAEDLIEVAPRPGEAVVRRGDLLERIEREAGRLALVLLGNVNFRTGQAFDIPGAAAAARRAGCPIGLDLAHGAGNLLLKLHDWGVDFAVWCTYKYLNAGPGGVGGCFVHERHCRDKGLPRFAGWWGHDKPSRLRMPPDFDPLPGAEGWQLSNPPILQLAALRASLELFDAAGMPALRKRSELLTGYLEFLLDRLPAGVCAILTPRDPAQRGSQLSFKVRGSARRLVERLGASGVICDVREPDVVRAAPVPLYTSFSDVHRLAQALDPRTPVKARRGADALAGRP